METLFGLAGRFWRWLTDDDQDSFAEVYGARWESERRERQLQPFVVDPGGLFSAEDLAEDRRLRA